MLALPAGMRPATDCEAHVQAGGAAEDMSMHGAGDYDDMVFQLHETSACVHGCTSNANVGVHV